MQFARPISDITNGGWQRFGTSSFTTDLWRLITEPVPADTTGIRTGNTPAGVEFEAGLSIIGPPADSSDLTLRYRYSKNTSGGVQVDLLVRVLDGTTQVASVNQANISNVITESTLTVPFSGVTNWDDLRVEFTATAVGGGAGRSAFVYNCRLEGADDTGPGIVTELRALTPWALYRFREGAGAVANDELANAHMAAANQTGGYTSRPTFGQATMLPDGTDTAAAFDGVDDRVESAGFTSYLGDGTIVALLKGGASAGRAANETLFRCQSAGTAGLVAIQWGASGQYVLHWRDDAASGSFTDLWTPAEDDIDLVFIVTDGTDLRVYRNGSTTSEFTTTAQTAQGHDEIGVGANKTGDALAEFDIQTLAVFRSALTETNRLAIHDAFAGAGGAVELAGSISATGTPSGDLQRIRTLTGAAAGIGQLAASLIPIRTLAGTVDGISTLAGTLIPIRVLAGTFAGTSSLAGDLTRIRALNGEVAGAGVFSGDIEIIVAGLVELNGTITAVATLQGDLIRVRTLDGDIVAQSTLTGDVIPRRALTGSVDAVSALTAALTRLRTLVGSVDGTADLAAVMQAVRDLSGSVDATAVLTGTLGIGAAPAWWTPDPVGYTRDPIAYTSAPIAYTRR
jgi:hypothetical protein